MQYIKVKWIHSLPEEPILLYSELDENRWEVRKVELFADGHCGYASSCESTNSTRLSLEPIPKLTEIAADPQFLPFEITQEEFESVWRRRQSEK